METRRQLTYHDHSCCRCGAVDKLIAISEFGKALCPACYPEFFRRRVESTIRRFRMIPRHSSVVVAVSGGGDSGALMHTLGRMRARLSFSLTAVHLDMGLGEYSEASLNVAQRQAEQAGVALKTAHVSQWGVSVGPVHKWPVCAVCGAIRRSILPRMVRDIGADVVCTGHTLDDQLQYMLKNILSGRLTCPVPLLPPILGYPAKSKPLIQIPDQATKEYCELEGIERVTGSCPSFDPASHRFKEVFHLMEREAPMSKQQFWQTMRKAMMPEDGDDGRGVEEPCVECNEPTRLGTCPLCRLRAFQSDDTIDEPEL